MEILLLQDITGVGKKNDLLVVGDGFALNYLLPRRAALVATPLVRKRYAESIRKRAEEREHEKSQRMGAVKAIEGKTVTFARKATKTGKLYAAITEDDILKALKEQLGIDAGDASISLDEPIKALGATNVELSLSDQIAHITVNVEAEKAAK